MTENNHSEQSAFNFGVSYLMQIDHSFKMATQASADKDLEGWCSWSRAVFRYLSAKLSTEEDQEFITLFNAVYEQINRNGLKRKRMQIGLLLDEIDRQLKKKLQSKGMLLPSKNDPKYAILQT